MRLVAILVHPSAGDGQLSCHDYHAMIRARSGVFLNATSMHAK